MQNMKLRFPGGKKKAFTMSYDDGVEQDVRLIAIMRENGVKGTFNLNGGCFAPEGTKYPAGQIHRRMDLQTSLEAYKGDDIEVAVHAYTHPFLEAIPPATAMMQIVKDRLSLESAFGKIVRGMAYPFGTYDETVVEILRLAGIAYSRTTEARLDFRIPKDWLRMGATCHHNHPKLMELAETFLSAEPTQRQESFLFYLWGHSYEFEKDDNWNVIETFLKNIGGREDVWYATNIEIYDYVKAFEALTFSVDAKIVHNPTSTDVWAEIDSRMIFFPAGKTVVL